MIKRALLFAFALIVVAAVANAQLPHFDPATGQPDPGVTTPLPGGGTETKYKDGYSQKSEPDPANPGWKKITEYDPLGRLILIWKFDGNGVLRHVTGVTYLPNGKHTESHQNYDANGKIISMRSDTFGPGGSMIGAAVLSISSGRWTLSSRPSSNGEDKAAHAAILASAKQ
jgi:hypothetical protein